LDQSSPRGIDEHGEEILSFTVEKAQAASDPTKRRKRLSGQLQRVYDQLLELHNRDKARFVTPEAIVHCSNPTFWACAT